MNDLALRTVGGFVALLVVLGVVLFGPAWTVDYWQAWVYLLIFGGSSALITVYLWQRDPALLERRVNAGPAAEKEGSQQVIQLGAAIAFIGMFVIASLDRRFGRSAVPVAVTI